VSSRKGNFWRLAVAGVALCYRWLSFCNGKLITANPLHGQRKLARRNEQRGGNNLLPGKVSQLHLFPTAQALDARPDTRSEAFNRRSTRSLNHPGS